MNTLIVYAGKYGFTAECVFELGKKLKGKHDIVDVNKKNPPSISGYDNVIVGSSVYIGQIDKNIKKWCADNQNMLLEVNTAIFLSCGIPENLNEVIRNNFPSKLVEKSVHKVCFGGELRTEKMSFAHKMITAAMKKAAGKEGRPLPCRKPENITLLADSINKFYEEKSI